MQITEDSAPCLTLHGLLHLLFYTFQDITTSGLSPLIFIILPHKHAYRPILERHFHKYYSLFPDMSTLVSNWTSQHSYSNIVSMCMWSAFVCVCSSVYGLCKSEINVRFFNPFLILRHAFWTGESQFQLV